MSERSNGFDAIIPHAEAMEDIERHLEDLKIKYMNDCRDHREAQKRRIKMVKAEGFSVIAFKAVLKKRRLNKKIEKIDEEMAEVEETETFEQMQHALGMLSDLPLGQAILERAEARKKKDADDVDSLTDDEDDDAPDPGAAHVASNVKALRDGIRSVP